MCLNKFAGIGGASWGQFGGKAWALHRQHARPIGSSLAPSTCGRSISIASANVFDFTNCTVDDVHD